MNADKLKFALSQIAQCMAATPDNHPEAKEIHARAERIKKANPNPLHPFPHPTPCRSVKTPTA